MENDVFSHLSPNLQTWNAETQIEIWNGTVEHFPGGGSATSVNIDDDVITLFDATEGSFHTWRPHRGKKIAAFADKQ